MNDTILNAIFGALTPSLHAMGIKIGLFLFALVLLIVGMSILAGGNGGAS